MNTYGWQLASWAAQIEGRQPFYLAMIDGESRLGFVNSHFYLQFQQDASLAEESFFKCFIDDRDRGRFETTFSACLADEKDITVNLRMHAQKEHWVKWELRFLEAVSDGPGRLFCLGYAMSEQEIAATKAGAETENCEASDGNPDWATRLARQKELMQRKVREAGIHGEEQERERIGRELHDNINQIMTSAQLYLSCLTRDNPDFDMLKTKTADILAMAIEEIRCLSHNIVPPDLQEQGLIESIERRIDEIRLTGRIEIDFCWSDLMTIETQDEDLKLTVYRIVQEQIHNICKYSQASRVQIFLVGRNEQLRLQIIDNGIGFDAKTVSEGLGLAGIRRRAKLFKGKAVFNSAPGKGCAMIVTIPLQLRQII